MTSRGQEKGLQPYGALDCFGWRSEGVQGASGKPPAFLPEYLYPVGFFANYGPKGVQANNKRSARQCGPRRLFAPRKAPVFSRRLRPEGGAGGERREARAQWAQPPKAVSAPEFRQTTSGAHGSAGRADCLPRGKPPSAPAGAYPIPLIRRLPEGVQGGT